MISDVKELRERLREGPYGFYILLRDGKSIQITRRFQMSISPDESRAVLWDAEDHMHLFDMEEVEKVSDTPANGDRE